MAAGLTFAAAAALVYAPVLQSGPASFTPVSNDRRITLEYDTAWRLMDRADHRYHLYLVGRGARALSLHPLRYFEGEHCHPFENSVALGENLLTAALLAIPAYWASGGDVELAYNFALIETTLIGAAAMFALVRAWTDHAPAGIAASLLYVFHDAHLADTTHFFSYDTSWTILALLFSERLFSRGRWRDALALAACIALQLGTGLYPLVGGFLLALPFGAWLLVRSPPDARRAAQLAVAAALVAPAAVFVFGPYLELRSSGRLGERTVRGFGSWTAFLPGGAFFPGTPCLVLAALGLAWRRRGTGTSGVCPVVPLALGASLVVATALGPNLLGAARVPVLWEVLARLLPGLDNVRAIIRIATQAHLALAILAGFGFAALMRRLPRRAAGLAEPAVLLAVLAEVLYPWLPTSASHSVYTAVRTEPAQDELQFFRELNAIGNRGPIFEWPLPPAPPFVAVAERLNAAAYHHRPVNTCYGSYMPDRSREDQMKGMLPSPAALAALRLDGFTTLLAYHEPREREAIVRRYDEQTVERGGLLQKVLGSPRITAYEIRG